MIKTEIKNFALSIDNFKEAPVTLPASVFASLWAAGVASDPYFSDNIERYSALRSQRAVLCASFDADSLSASSRRVLLRLHRVDAPISVELNGTEVGTAEGECRDFSFDVTGILRAGENSLTIAIGPDCDPSEDRLSHLTLGGCEIIAYNFDVISSVRTRIERLDDVVRLHLALDTLESNGTTRAVATLVSPGGRVFYCGLMDGRGYIDITEPNLWWPNELGVQNLYRLTVNLYADSEIVDSLERRIGLALFDTEQTGSPMPPITVNGVSLYSRGSLYLSDDALSPMLDPVRTESLVRSAHDAGYNTLVLPDLGVLPERHLFDACNRMGITVWLGIDTDREGDLASRISRIVPLLYEVSLGVLLLSGSLASDARGMLAEHTHGKAVAVVDSVESLVLPATASLPAVSTVRSFLPAGQLNIFSPAMQYHSTVRDNRELISSAVYKYPNGIGELSYATEMEQHYREKAAIISTRRARERSMHSILPRLCDMWPAVSDAHIDYLGVPKAQHYLVRSLFAPVFIGAVNDGTRVTFFVSNERKTTYRGRLEYAVLSSSLETLFADSFDIEVAENSTSEMPPVELGELLDGHLNEYFLVYSISENMITTSKGTLLFTSPRCFEFKKPTFMTDISGSGTDFVLSISSDVFSSGVCVSFETPLAMIEENFFDLTDTSPRRIELKTARTVAPEVLRRELFLRSAYDIGRED